MKAIFLSFSFLLMAAVDGNAQMANMVGQGSLDLPRGIGGYDEISYAFAKGDVVTLEADANKLLERIMVTLYPSDVLKRVKHVRKATTTFTVPQEGFVVIRFISDRPGGNTVRYTVTRTPGPGGPVEYDTKIRWVKPVETIGGMVPKRGE